MPVHRRFKGHKDLELEHAQALLRCRHRSSQVREQMNSSEGHPMWKSSLEMSLEAHCDTVLNVKPKSDMCMQHRRDAGVY